MDIWFAIGPALFFGLVVLGIIVMGMRGKREQNERRARRAAARPATAVILDSSTKQTSSGEGAAVITTVYFTLEVETPTGTVRTEARWGLKDALFLDRVKAGKTISVLVDVDDPRLLFSNEPWLGG